MQISKETIDALQSKFPEFEEACHSFFKGELPPAKYKGISGRFGSYAEKGENRLCSVSGSLAERFLATI